MDNLKESINTSFVTFEGIIGKITDKLCVGLKENNPDGYLLNAVFGARALSLIDVLTAALDRLKEHFNESTLRDIPVSELTKNMTPADLCLLMESVGVDRCDQIMKEVKDRNKGKGVH
jgi:hypothetical protein